VGKIRPAGPAEARRLCAEGEGPAARIRIDRILPVLDPSIRELIKKQVFFQVLESWEPRLGQSLPGAPVGERIFEI
jgi:hypothetical protein